MKFVVQKVRDKKYMIRSPIDKDRVWGSSDDIFFPTVTKYDSIELALDGVKNLRCFHTGEHSEDYKNVAIREFEAGEQLKLL